MNDEKQIVNNTKNPLTYVNGFLFGAGDEARTRYLNLGKVALYQMSYTRIFRRCSGDVLYYTKAL